MTRNAIGLAAIVAAVCCLACGGTPAAPTPPTPPASSNHAPVGSVALSPAGAPIAGATALTFTATASDPDGDAVSLSWQFGDGQTASGATVGHVFAEAGTYAVVLTASDSHGEATKLNTSVVVKGLAGDWLDIGGKVGFTFEQHGSNVEGIKASEREGNAAVRGSVQNPRSLSLELTYAYYPSSQLDYYRCYYEGALDDTGDQFRLTFNYKRSDRHCRKDNYTATRHPY